MKDHLRSQFQISAGASTDVMSLSWGARGPTSMPETRPTLDVTDISNKKFQLPDVKAANVSSVARANATTVDTQVSRDQVNGVKEAYIQEDQMIKNTIHDALNEVLGPEDGSKMMVQLGAGGDITKVQAAAQVFDPTGVAGGAYAALNSLQDAATRFNDAEINEALEKALNVIHESQEAAANPESNGGQPPVLNIPEGLDFTKMEDWQMMRDFLERDIEDDPVMQDVAEAHIALDEVELNNDIVEGHDHREGDLHEKAIKAADAGNEAAVREYTADEIEADAVMAGEDLDDIDPEYPEQTLPYLSGVASDSALAADQETQEIKAAVARLHNELKPEEMGLERAAPASTVGSV